MYRLQSNVGKISEHWTVKHVHKAMTTFPVGNGSKRYSLPVISDQQLNVVT